MTVHIVIDSNIIVKDRRLNSTTFQILLDPPEGLDLQLYVPEIVLDESVNNFRESIYEILINADEFCTNLTEEIVSDKIILYSTKDKNEIASLSEYAERKCNEYAKWLDKMLHDKNVQICDYPEIEHKELVERALWRRKPFAKNAKGYEKGYRDSLVWESVLLVADEAGDEIVYFISSNKNEFGDLANRNSTRLHSDLIDDLEERFQDKKRVKYYLRLNDFRDDVIDPLLEAVNIKTELLKGGFENFNLIVSTQEIFSDETWNLNFPREIWDEIPSVYEEVQLERIELSAINEIIDVRRLRKNELMAEVVADVRLICNCQINEANMSEMSGVEDETFMIMGSVDRNLNWAEFNIPAKIYFVITFDSDGGNRISYEIVSMHNEYWKHEDE